MGFNYKNRPEKKEKDIPLTAITTYIPTDLFNEMKRQSGEKEIPMSRLAAYAIYNELELGPASFTFNIEMPTDEFIEGQYAKEASQLMGLINQFKNGISLDLLMMARRMAKIESEKTFMLAYRELLNAEVIYEVHPSSVRMPGHYHKDYVHVMPMKLNLSDKEFKKKKLNGEGPLNDAIKSKK